MNDSSSKAQGQRPGVYASRKPGAAAVPPTPPTPYKAIDLADVVSGQFDEEDAVEDVAQDLGKRVLCRQHDRNRQDHHHAIHYLFPCRSVAAR
jgi:23S rRNA pseudouridine2605 synthase